MESIRDMILSLGGFAQKRQLVRRGASDRHLTDAVRDASVIRVRNGWYSTRPPDDPVVRAVRVGGRLTGLSAVSAWGGWVRVRPPIHVSLAPNAARMRTAHNRRRRLDVTAPGEVVLHWDDRDLLDRGTSTEVSVLDALFRVVLDENLEDAVAALDWALHVDRIDRIDLEQLILRLPVALRWIGDWTDAACESLPESLSRTRFRLAGHRVRTQVPLVSEERIDVVVDDTAAVEVDGEQFHANRFAQDRAKDIRITLAGYHSLRPTASMVFDAWADVYRAVLVALTARGQPAPLPVGNSGYGRLGPAGRSTFVRRGPRRHRRAPEFPTESETSGAGPVGATRMRGEASRGREG